MNLHFDMSKEIELANEITFDLRRGDTLKGIARSRGIPYQRVRDLSAKYRLREMITPSLDDLQESFRHTGSYAAVNREFSWLRYNYVRMALRGAGVSSPVGRRCDK